MTGIVETNKKPQKKKSGRPQKTVSRSKILMVRLTATEKMLITERAKKAGLKPSDWFRKAAKGARVFPRFTAEESSWFRMLAGMANNLNQLTRLANASSLFSLALKCQSQLKQIEEVLTKINRHDG